MNRDQQNHLKLRKLSVMGKKYHRFGAVRVGQVRPPPLGPLVYIRAWLIRKKTDTIRIKQYEIRIDSKIQRFTFGDIKNLDQ